MLAGVSDIINGIYFVNCEFQGPVVIGANNSGFLLDSVANIDFRNCEFTHGALPQLTILLGEGGRNTRCFNCEFIGLGQLLLINADGGTLHLERCTFEDSLSAQVDCRSLSLSEMTLLTVLRCSFFDGGLAVRCLTLLSLQMKIIIEGCRIGSRLALDAFTGDAILISELLDGTDGCIIRGNTINNCSLGIRLDGNGNLVLRNNIRNCTSLGIRLRGRSDTVTRNTINLVGGDGIDCDLSTLVLRNRIRNCGGDGINASRDSCIITNNTISNVLFDGISADLGGHRIVGDG